MSKGNATLIACCLLALVFCVFCLSAGVVFADSNVGPGQVIKLLQAGKIESF